MTTSIEKLERDLEALVQAHLVEWERAAASAVRRAFAGAQAKQERRARSVPPRTSPRRTCGPRRSSAQLAELGERLYEAIRARPGAAMVELAPVVGATPKELNRPMNALRRAGRIRSVGQRQGMRYFPMVRAAE